MNMQKSIATYSRLALAPQAAAARAEGSVAKSGRDSVGTEYQTYAFLS